MSRKGIRIMLAGLLVMVAGYVLMMGGFSPDPNVFNYAMFDARRLVAAPMAYMLRPGFADRVKDFAARDSGGNRGGNSGHHGPFRRQKRG